jgi:hypothetical protein
MVGEGHGGLTGSPVMVPDSTRRTQHWQARPQVANGAERLLRASAAAGWHETLGPVTEGSQWEIDGAYPVTPRGRGNFPPFYRGGMKGNRAHVNVRVTDRNVHLAEWKRQDTSHRE